MQIRNRVIYRQGNEELNATGASTFALMDERNSMTKTIEYMEMLVERGISLFRAILLVAWGPLWHGEDGFCWPWGGQMYPIDQQDRNSLNEQLFNRINEVLNYCKERGFTVYLDLLDNSLYETGLGAAWYLTPDHGWEIYLDRIAEIYARFRETLIIGLGNEPSKRAQGKVLPIQQWMATYLASKGVNVIGAEVTWGLEPLRDHSAVNIIALQTSRNDNPSVVQETWDQLVPEYFATDKVIISKEPPRRLYHWADDEVHLGWLRDIAYLTFLAGAQYVHHGLGDGEEDQITCHPMWGCNANDWLQVPEAVDRFFKTFSTSLVPSRHATRFYGPDMMIIKGVGDGAAYAAVHDKLRVVYCKTASLTLDVPYDYEALAVDAVTGIVRQGPVRYPTGQRVVRNWNDCIVRIRQVGPPVVR